MNCLGKMKKKKQQYTISADIEGFNHVGKTWDRSVENLRKTWGKQKGNQENLRNPIQLE